MKFRLVEKTEYLHDPEDRQMIAELENICKLHYDWGTKSSYAIEQIYKRHAAEINQYYIDKEQAEWEAERVATRQKRAEEEARKKDIEYNGYGQLSIFDEDFEEYNANPYDKNEGDCL